MTNKFIHCDCDCFFAAIEIRDDPGLAGLPVAVGGSEDRRGVIATCNYEARKYGVHSAMASATAKRLCRDLIIIPGNMEKYRIASQEMHAIFQDFTELIEPLSLDEAFLDVTDVSLYKGSATLIAKEIRRRVREEIKITLSAGIAPNKFLAKIASDWNKPDGQYVITPEMVPKFIAKLNIRKIYGVGKVTAGKMNSLGIETCKDLQQYSLIELTEMFGSFGDTLYSLCRGIDNRKLTTQRQRKSISVEHTFAEDIQNLEQCLATLPDLIERLERRVQNSNKEINIAKQFVKLKFNDFVSTTVEQNGLDTDIESFRSLCATGFKRGNRPVRLLGVGVRMKESSSSNLFYQFDLNFKALETLDEVKAH